MPRPEDFTVVTEPMDQPAWSRERVRVIAPNQTRTLDFEVGTTETGQPQVVVVLDDAHFVLMGSCLVQVLEQLAEVMGRRHQHRHV